MTFVAYKSLVRGLLLGAILVCSTVPGLFAQNTSLIPEKLTPEMREELAEKYGITRPEQKREVKDKDFPVTKEFEGIRFDQQLDDEVYEPLELSQDTLTVEEVSRQTLLPNSILILDNNKIVRLTKEQFKKLISLSGIRYSQTLSTELFIGQSDILIPLPQELGSGYIIAEPEKLAEQLFLVGATERLLEGKDIRLARTLHLESYDILPIGEDYFAPARERILSIEKAIKSGKIPAVQRQKALEGYVGPLDMISSHIDTGAPERYFLSPGDAITLTYWSSDQQQETITVVIDDDGSVEIPGAGRFVAQGMTLDQFERAAYGQFKRVSAAMDFHLVATMESLKSISVDIRGEAFRPGGYKISSVTTLFNALLACGGPNDNGSLRNIRLLRGKKVYHVDFYDYLIHGNNDDNYALQGGDIIFIPKAGRKVRLSGEVYRPAVYELHESEGLQEVIALAGGVKPTAVTAQMLIHTIVPGREKMVRTVDLGKKSDMAKVALQDGDRLSVRAVVKAAVNYVTVQGNVSYPGDYELIKNMRVKELLLKAEILPDTYTEQAVLTRYDKEDKTTTRVNINLSSLLKGDESQDLVLQDLDELRVYSKEEAKYIPKREVQIIGHVQRSGTYPRSEGMRLRALLFAAGGLLPGYDSMVHISRARTDKETKILAVDVNELLAGMEAANIQLHDNDVVTVRRRADFYETPKWVTIRGEVHVPGPYALKNKKVTLRQLLEMAGGFTESAYPKGLVLRRKSQYITFGDQVELLKRANRSAVEELRQAYLRAQARNRAQLAVLQGKAVEDAPAPTRFEMPAITDTDDLEKTMAASTIPSIAGGGGKMVEKAFELAESSPALGVSRREFGEKQLLFDEKERIVVDIDKVLEGKEDMVLKPGDEIIVPQVPGTVSVVGAVSTPLTLGYDSDRWIDDYIARVGGYAEDADEDRVRVIRMDGTIMLSDDIEEVERGDIIYVPTKVMTADIKTSTDKILDVVKYSVSTAASLLIFFSLAGGL